MRAVVCHEFTEYRNLKVEPFPDPELRDGHVLIDTHAAGLGFATSLWVAGRYQRKPPLPFVPGTEISGVVSAVGAGVEHVRAGDRVVATLDWGGHAGRCLAHAACVHPIPDEMPFDDAVCFAITYPTSYGALVWRARLQENEALLVHGAAGAVGLAALQIGKALGARVIATASTRQRLEFAMAHGADHGIALEEGTFYEKVRDLTGGLGADVIFDPYGGPVTNESLRCIAHEGRLLTIGYAAGEIPQIPANRLLLKNCSVMGFNLGEYVGWGPIDQRVRYGAQVAEMQADLQRHYSAGSLRPVVDRIFTLDEFVPALDALLNREVQGKAIFTVTDADR